MPRPHPPPARSGSPPDLPRSQVSDLSGWELELEVLGRDGQRDAGRGGHFDLEHHLAVRHPPQPCHQLPHAQQTPSAVSRQPIETKGWTEG
eukprot:1468973-Rhodomonas_salina.3